MKVYVVSPYYHDGVDGWGEPERVFTDPERAWRYRSAGDMEVTELDLDEDTQGLPPEPVERPKKSK